MKKVIDLFTLSVSFACAFLIIFSNAKNEENKELRKDRDSLNNVIEMAEYDSLDVICPKCKIRFKVPGKMIIIPTPDNDSTIIQ